MKNNIKALIVHLIIAGIFFALLIGLVISGPKFGRYTTNIISRLFFTVLIMIVYVYVGTLLDIKEDKKHDFFIGNIIGLIGIGLWIYGFLKTDKNLTKTPKELSEYWMAFNLYYSPFTVAYFFLNITVSPIVSLFTNLLPALFMGCGMRYKRLKVRKNM